MTSPGRGRGRSTKTVTSIVSDGKFYCFHGDRGGGRCGNSHFCGDVIFEWPLRKLVMYFPLSDISQRYFSVLNQTLPECDWWYQTRSAKSNHSWYVDFIFRYDRWKDGWRGSRCGDDKTFMVLWGVFYYCGLIVVIYEYYRGLIANVGFYDEDCASLVSDA